MNSYKIWVDGKLAGGYLTQKAFNDAMKAIKALYPLSKIQTNVKI